MLTEHQRFELIDVSIKFMQTVSNIYGSDKGMELWSSIAGTIDEDLKGQVFMAMLTGDGRKDKLTVKIPHAGWICNKVSLIRCIRTHDRRKLDLLKAKNIVDRIQNGGIEILEVDPESRSTFILELRKLGLDA